MLKKARQSIAEQDMEGYKILCLQSNKPMQKEKEMRYFSKANSPVSGG